MMEELSYYKVLGENGEACNGGAGEWHLPKGKRAGKWMPAIDKVDPCNSGYHVCRRDDLINWLGSVIYTVEVRGEIVNCENKVVAGQARLLTRLDTWNDVTARLFACECAEDVAHLNTDERVMDSIQTTRKFALGKATQYELNAAWDAAWDAASTVARSAASTATWSVARDAARDAASAAACSAASTAASTAARSAARDAARDAASAAACSATSAATWSVARSAAWSAQRKKQTRLLFDVLNGRVDLVTRARRKLETTDAE